MKRLLVLLSIVTWPLSAVIVSGYKYQCGDATVYFLGDSHIEQYLTTSPITNDQCEELKKIFTQLGNKETRAFFVEYDSTDQEKNEIQKVLGEMNAFLKEKYITFQNEDGLKKQFINTHTFLVGGLMVSEVRRTTSGDQREESLKNLVPYFKETEPYSLFSSEKFMNELRILEDKAGLLFRENELSNETLENKKDISLFTTLVFRPSFIKDLGKLYDRYREKLISNFVEESIKNGKKTIVVIAGQNHIDALRRKRTENVKILKEFERKNPSGKSSQVPVLTVSSLRELFSDSSLRELFSEPTFWERLKHQAYEWRKILIPAAVTGLGVGYWWLKSRSKSATPNLTHK